MFGLVKGGRERWVGRCAAATGNNVTDHTRTTGSRFSLNGQAGPNSAHILFDC